MKAHMEIYATLAAALSPFGLLPRGGFHPEAGDGVPPLPSGRRVGTVILAGNAGPAMWEAFAVSAEARDGKPDPLDRWTVRVLSSVAAAIGAALLFPFGPGARPIFRWAKRAEGIAQSPIGLLIHPDYGLWHAYRGVFCFETRHPVPPPLTAAKPCEGCVAKPCLTTCPVGAFQNGAYDVPRCIGHLESPEGGDCRGGGCLARRACPVGPAYAPPQAGFHMAAFLRAAGAGKSAGNQ
ncbi:MAG: hypothetical protein AB1781_04690 [Pseudomonadota bacterium]